MNFRNIICRTAIGAALISSGVSASTTLLDPPLVASQQASDVAAQFMVTPGATGCPEVKDSISI